MSGVTGRLMKFAFAKFGTNSWGVAASVTKGHYFESDGGIQFQPEQITDNAFNQTFLAPADSGFIQAPQVTLQGRSRYNDWSYIWDALAMGSPAAVTIATSAAGQNTSWRHVMDMAPAIDGLGLTAAIDRFLYVEEYTSVKVHGFEESEDSNGAMNVGYHVTVSAPTNISSVNINSTVAGANYPALTARILQHQGVFRMNVASAGSLVAADALQVEHVKLTFNRPQDAPHVFGQRHIAEPADNDFPEIMVELTYPRMNTPSANSLFAALSAAQTFKADWTFTGDPINSTDAYTKLYQFPCLQLATDGFQTPTNGAGQVKPTAKFMARLAPTSPSGMAFVNPMRLTRIMTNSLMAFSA